MTDALEEYHKIDSIYKRDQKGKFLLGDWSRDEFSYLQDSPWRWTEKVDGTNIRLAYEHNGFRGNEHAYIAGRTDSAQIPPFLLARLIELMQKMPFEEVFESLLPDGSVTLYGEGYGARIQKGGGNYIPDGCDFVLFDVKIGNWWLTRESVEEVAEQLGIDVVPIVMTGTIHDAIDLVKDGYKSQWAGVTVPEGLVGVPTVDLFDRRGKRIITKVKARDFS